MNGPEHYREAERLITLATDSDGGVVFGGDLITDTISLAQVHATLALAAATATPIKDAAEWFQATDATR